jgi:hypothetical protein
MTTDHDTQTRIVVAWLREDAHENAERVLLAALNEVDHTRQRRSWWPAWRFSNMNNLAKVLVATAAVVIVAVAGINFFPGSETGTGAVPPSSSPAPSPSPSPSVTPGAAPSPSAPPLTQTFTSTMHGVSMSYPEGWTAQAATESWRGPLGVSFGQASADFLYDPSLTDHLFLIVTSQAIGKSTPQAWVAKQQNSEEGCTGTEPVTVDGADGLIGTGECNKVAVATDGRGYVIALYTSDDEAWLGVTYDRAWFEQVLATVQFHPENAR